MTAATPAATAPATPPATRAATSTRPAPRAHLRSVAAGPADFPSRAAAAGIPVGGPLRHGPLAVDASSYLVTLDGTPLELSPRQVELLAVFLAAPKRVLTRDQLHWLCWGDTAPSRRVDVQLCRLRARTGLDLFRNVRDRGWALREL